MEGVNIKIIGLKIKEKKLGFTLVELMVVMGIIAVLTLISAAGLMAGRDQAIVSDATENILSSIREVQNYSMSVREGNPDNTTETKVWAIRLINGTNQYSTYYLEEVEPGTTNQLSANFAESKSFPEGVSITTSYVSGPDEIQDATNDDRYIFFSSPFGKLATSNSSCEGMGGSCYWEESKTRSDKAWVINTGEMNADEAIRIKVEYKGKSQIIRINSLGDSKIE